MNDDIKKKIDKIVTYCQITTAFVFALFFIILLKFGLPTKANEIGDFVAGFASIIAFIWLWCSIKVQQLELLENREIIYKKQESQDKKDCVDQVMLMLKSIGNILDEISLELEKVAKTIESEPIDADVITSFNSIDIIRNLMKADTKLVRSTAFAGIWMFLSRYENQYEKLMDYLYSNDHGPWTKHFFIEKSIHENCYFMITNEIIPILSQSND